MLRSLPKADAGTFKAGKIYGWVIRPGQYNARLVYSLPLDQIGNAPKFLGTIDCPGTPFLVLKKSRHDKEYAHYWWTMILTCSECPLMGYVYFHGADSWKESAPL